MACREYCRNQHCPCPEACADEPIIDPDGAYRVMLGVIVGVLCFAVSVWLYFAWPLLEVLVPQVAGLLFAI